MQAISFLEKFGVLHNNPPSTWHKSNLWGENLPTASPGDEHLLGDYWVNLDDFWRRHACYAATTGLWEALRDPLHKDLRQAVATVASRLSDFAAIGHPLETLFADVHAILEAPTSDDLALAPAPLSSDFAERDTPPMVKWVTTAREQELGEVAISLIHENLNAAAADARLSWHVERVPLENDVAALESGNVAARRGRLTFAMQFRPRSLWGQMWVFFGLDTRDGIGWRVCPSDGRLFYPPRRDRYFCTAAEQRRATKQESRQRTQRRK